MKTINISLIFSFVTTFFCSQLFADERIRSREQLLQEGYSEVVPVKKIPGTAIPTLPAPAHSLSWPVSFEDQQHSLGNSMGQFQPFGTPPYYHGGDDVRVQNAASVFAPVTGKIEAGHYSYTTNQDGSLTKFWRAWPQTGQSVYFEVALVTADGFRFEFHHMNRSSLPAKIVQILNAGGGIVEAGTLLGQAVYFPVPDYQHIHYNVITADGIRVNPEMVSTLIADQERPDVSGIYAIGVDGSIHDFANGNFKYPISEFVAAVEDHQNENIYVHPPVTVSLVFDNGTQSGWDFSQFLTFGDGKFPPIWNFFRKSLRTPGGQVLNTDGGYGEGLSLVRLPVPQNAYGHFKISISDIAGNVTSFEGSLSKE